MLRKLIPQYDVVMTISLKKPVLGREIRDAFKRVVQYHHYGVATESPMIRDTDVCIMLCNVSHTPYCDLQLRVDGEEYLAMNQTYSRKIEVIYQPWAGEKDAVGYNFATVSSSMKRFRDALEAALVI